MRLALLSCPKVASETHTLPLRGQRGKTGEQPGAPVCSSKSGRLAETWIPAASCTTCEEIDLVAFLVFHLGILVVGLHLHHLGAWVGERGGKERGINTQAGVGAIGRWGRRGCPRPAWPGASRLLSRAPVPGALGVQAWARFTSGPQLLHPQTGPDRAAHTGLPGG